MDHDVVAQQANACRPARHTFGDQTARHVTHVGHLEDFLDRRVTDEGFAHFGLQQARSRRFHVIDQVIDDAVIANLHALLVGTGPRAGIGPHVEPDDRGTTCFGQTNVRVGDGPHTRMQHAHAHLIVADFFHRLKNGLGRSLHISLHQNRQFRYFLVSLGLRHQLFQRRCRTGCRTFVLGRLFAIVRNLAGLRLGFHDVQRIAGLRCPVQAQNLDRN